MRKCNRYCDEIENVENYEKAKADNFKGWECHHRLELIETGGVCDVDRQDLIDWNIYWHRPADELIFLTRKEHNLLHKKDKTVWNKGKHHSEETKQKISEANRGKCRTEEFKKNLSEKMKGERHPFYGKLRSEETKQKISEAMKKMTGETKNKMSEAHKGKHWKLVDGKRVWY